VSIITIRTGVATVANSTNLRNTPAQTPRSSRAERGSSSTCQPHQSRDDAPRDPMIRWVDDREASRDAERGEFALRSLVKQDPASVESRVRPLVRRCAPRLPCRPRRTGAVRVRLGRGSCGQRGEVASDANVDLLVEIAFGTIWYRRPGQAQVPQETLRGRAHRLRYSPYPRANTRTHDRPDRRDTEQHRPAHFHSPPTRRKEAADARTAR
jgi:hypothetical protein